MTPEEAVQEYQCPGCVGGPFPECYKLENGSVGCIKHCAGTMVAPGIGRIFLGLPKGFNRLGRCENTKVYIWQSINDSEWIYNFLNVPIWKYLDEHGNTLVRMIAPRINDPNIHIYLENCIDKIDCYEITKNDLEGID